VADTTQPITIAALYQFADLGEQREAHHALREPVREIMANHEIKGSILLAHEGINGTVAGPAAGIEAFVHFLKHDPIFQGKLDHMELKFAYAEDQPFKKLKVLLKKEIVTMGAPLSPEQASNLEGMVGKYVEPADWNALIDDPEVTLVDTRNDYEFAVGTFEKATGETALDPDTESFSDFPQYVDTHLDPAKHKKVAMFCTGGIRCEKATAYLKQQGFEDVFHLKGGILKYLETVDEKETRWQGECYVFDGRVTVDHSLEQGNYVTCFACGRPVSEEGLTHELYEPGVSCGQCYDEYTDDQRIRFAERQKQIDLAKTRGE
jgi:UPF0176 protein